jgi:hypothetical protein
LQGQLHLAAGLAHAREDDLGRVATGGQHALEFTPRDDIEAQTHLGEQLQHGEVAVGLHGVAQQVGPALQRALVALCGLPHGLGRVGVERCPELPCKRLQVAAIQRETAVGVRQMWRAGQGVHG